MIDIRPLRAEEIAEAKKLVPEACAEPYWNTCWAVLQDSALVGVLAMDTRLVVEPLYMKPGATVAAIVAMSWVDGALRGLGKPGYEFFIGDDHPEFQRFVAKHWDIQSGREKKGLYYFREFKK